MQRSPVWCTSTCAACVMGRWAQRGGNDQLSRIFRNCRGRTWSWCPLRPLLPLWRKHLAPIKVVSTLLCSFTSPPWFFYYPFQTSLSDLVSAYSEQIGSSSLSSSSFSLSPRLSCSRPPNFITMHAFCICGLLLAAVGWTTAQQVNQTR